MIIPGEDTVQVVAVARDGVEALEYLFREGRFEGRPIPVPELILLETDAPDMPPQWLYVNAAQRAAGQPQAVNTPAELPRIGAVLAQLRGVSVQAVAQTTTANAQVALPKLAALRTAV